MPETGLIQIYTGNGKGKSTAAFGLALRASGWGLKTVIIQFMKPGDGYGETKAIADLPLIEMYSYGCRHFLKKGVAPKEEDIALAAAALAKAEQALADESIDLLILDELSNAIYFDLVSEQQALSLLDKKRTNQELVITGRNAPACLIERADLVSEIKEIKHPAQQGVQARRGIEY